MTGQIHEENKNDGSDYRYEEDRVTASYFSRHLVPEKTAS